MYSSDRHIETDTSRVSVVDLVHFGHRFDAFLDYIDRYSISISDLLAVGDINHVYVYAVDGVSGWDGVRDPGGRGRQLMAVYRPTLQTQR